MDCADKVILKHYIETVLDKGKADKERAFAMGYIVGYTTGNCRIDFDTFDYVVVAHGAFLSNNYDALKSALSVLL